MLLHQLADAVVAGEDEAQTCAALAISPRMYEWLTGNDGFKLALEAARARREALTAATSQGASCPE